MNKALKPVLSFLLLALAHMTFVSCEDTVQKSSIEISIPSSEVNERIYGLWNNDTNESAPSLIFFENGMCAKTQNSKARVTGNYQIDQNVINLDFDGEKRKLSVQKLSNDSMCVEENGKLSLYRKSAGSCISADTYQKSICGTWHVTDLPGKQEVNEEYQNMLTFRSDGTCQYVFTDDSKCDMTYVLTADQILIIDPTKRSPVSGCWSIWDLSESLILNNGEEGFFSANKQK